MRSDGDVSSRLPPAFGMVASITSSGRRRSAEHGYDRTISAEGSILPAVSSLARKTGATVGFACIGRRGGHCIGLLIAAVCAGAAFAQQSSSTDSGADGVVGNPEREAYFGDLHLHTAFSFDAVASGTQTTPNDAYRYALGEPVEYLGRPVQRDEPLDFLAVTDHAEYLGVPYEAADPNGPFAGTRWPATLEAVEGDTLGFMRI